MELLFDVEERASSGVVKDFYTSRSNSTNEGYKAPLYVYDVLMDMVEADPILFTALSLTVELCTKNDYTIQGNNTASVEEATSRLNDDLDFDQVIKNVLWQMLVYGDAYIELVWNQSKTKITELHPLESSEMVIDYTEHGEIVNYRQRLAGKSKPDWPEFAPQDVIFFRHHWIGTQVYSKNPFKSISRSFATKMYANDYLQSIFRNLPPKIIYFLKNANKEQRKSFVADLIHAKTDSNSDIIASGEAFQSQMMQVVFDEGLLRILEDLRKDILMITRVPPHWVGMLDGANRGIGENVTIPYESKIFSLQHDIESKLSRELMSRLGYPDLKFKWNSISLTNEKEIIFNMGQLKAMGLNFEAIIQYGRDKGLKLSPDAKIELVALPSGGPQIQDETSSSRQRSSPISTMEQNLNKQGVSSAGKEKLESRKVI